MDKNELSNLIEEFKKAMHSRQFEKATAIADEIELKKIKDNSLLSLIADAYEITHKYKEAKIALMLAYENTNAGRHIAYRLCLISIKTKEFGDAEDYYEDFVEIAPRDSSRYVLKYKMAKAKGDSIDKLIEILEEYIAIDMEEKWTYELAKLYHLAGDSEKCVDICDEMSLWFADGKYVTKAMDLKKQYRPLTTSQKERYDEQKRRNMEEAAKKEAEEIEKKLKPFEYNDDTNIDAQVQAAVEKQIESSEDKFNTTDIQAVVAESVKETFNDIKEPEEVEPQNDEKADEDFGMTKVALDISQIQMAEYETKESDQEDTNEVNDDAIEEASENKSEESVEEPDKENAVEPIKDIKDVEDILKQLQARGILKAETVTQAVNIIAQDDNNEEASDDSMEEVIADNMTNEPAENDEVGEATEETTEETEPEEAPEQSGEDVVAGDTQNIPNIEDIRAAQDNKAEENAEEVKQPSPETTKEGTPVLDLGFEPEATENQESALNASEEISDKVEVISGTEWEQPKKEPVNVLTEEELTEFKNYLNVEGFASNIREVLTDLIVNYNPNGKSDTGNVIIMGNEKTGKTTLAVEIIKLVNKKRGRRDRKLAKIDASALNRRGFRNSLNRLMGSDLIIDNAGNLGAMTISEIVDASGMFTDDMLIIMEGGFDEMEKIISDSPRVESVFNHVITIREYDVKEWVEYAKKYAGQQGFKVDELANLALFKAVDDFFGENKGIGKEDVEMIVDNAIAKSGRLGRKLTGIFSSNKADEGMKVLLESDFNK